MEINKVTHRVDPINLSNRFTDKMNIPKDNGHISSNEDKKTYTEDELIRSIELANKEVIVYDKRFEFSIHKETKHIIVKVIDVATDEVISEIPPEKILDLVAELWKISGLIVDEKV